MKEIHSSIKNERENNNKALKTRITHLQMPQEL